MSHAVSPRSPRGGSARAALLSAAVLLASVAGACADTGVLEPTPSPVAATAASHHFTPTGGNVCGTSMVVPLRVVTARQDDEQSDDSQQGNDDREQTVGSVTVNNVRDHLHVIYTVDDGWELASTNAIVVAKPTEVIRRLGRSARRMPNYRSHDAGVTTWEYDIMLADLGVGADGKLVVVPIAKVRRSDEEDADELAVMAGNQTIRIGDRRLSYLRYRIRACEPSTSPTPPPVGDHAPGSGAVTVTFDDGFLSQYTTAFPIMKKYGLVGNLAVNSRAIDEGWSDYVTLPMVRELHDAGWAVVNHTWDHTDLATLSDAQQTDEIVRNRAWIEANGFRGAWVFVVPFHSWGVSTLGLVKQHSVAARGYSAQQLRTPQQYTPETDFLQTWPPQDPYKLTGDEPFAPGVAIETAKTELRAYLKRAESDGRFVDVFFHRIDPARVADFEALVKIIAEYKALVRPYDALVKSNGATVLVTR